MGTPVNVRGHILHTPRTAESLQSIKPQRGPEIPDAVMKNSMGLSRFFDDPLPADLHDLDAITFLFFYHDTRRT
jgi:hypothetical protein